MLGQRGRQLGQFATGLGGGGRQNTIKEYKITLFHFYGQAGEALKGNFALPPPLPFPPKDLGSPGGIQSDIY